jgi:hypothetical protein
MIQIKIRLYLLKNGLKCRKKTNFEGILLFETIEPIEKNEKKNHF